MSPVGRRSRAWEFPGCGGSVSGSGAAPLEATHGPVPAMPLPSASPLPSGSLLLGWRQPDSSAGIGFAAAGEAPDFSDTVEPCLADDEGHLVTFAPTGEGKGRSSIIPALLTFDGTAIVIDPKGEACAVTSAHRETLGLVVRLDPYGLTTEAPDHLNPFDLVDATGASHSEAALSLASLLAPRTFSDDPFWDNRATSIIAGVIAGLFATEPQETRHPVRLRAILSQSAPIRWPCGWTLTVARWERSRSRRWRNSWHCQRRGLAGVYRRRRVSTSFSSATRPWPGRCRRPRSAWTHFGRATR